MGNVVTIAACGKLLHNTRRMRRAMAILARGYHPVLFLMAKSAFERLVFGIAGAEEFGSLLMT